MGRSKGKGTLVKRGKIFTARWVVDGVVHTRSTGCANKKDAEKKLAEFVHPYQVDSDIEKLENLQSQIRVLEDERKRTPKEKSVRIKFAIDTYKKDVSRSPLSENSERLYNYVFDTLNEFAEQLDKPYLYQLNEKDAEKFMVKLKSMVGTTTYNQFLKVLRFVTFILMRQDTNIKKNVWTSFKQIKSKDSNTRRELSDEEMHKLLQAADDDKVPNVGLLFKIGAYTGLRKSDILKLKWSEVDLQDRMIRTLPAKTKRNGLKARIPIVDELYDALCKCKQDSEYVLSNLHGMSDNSISCTIKRVFKRAGIETNVKDESRHVHFTTGFHSLRHTLASKLHRSGTPIGQIQTILGHSKIDMSMHYAHTKEQDLQMPDFSDTTMSMRIKKETYELVMKKHKGNETFDDVVKRIFTTPYFDEDVMKLKKEKEEMKAKKAKELDAMIDEVMGA